MAQALRSFFLRRTGCPFALHEHVRGPAPNYNAELTWADLIPNDADTKEFTGPDDE
jgi:hypothetical protein